MENVTNKALDQQVGGDHYKTGMQPFEFSHRNGHDGATHAIIKYLTRYSRVTPEAGYTALQKAHHIAQLRAELIVLWGSIGNPELTSVTVPVGQYCRTNELDIHTTNTVHIVEAWFRSTDADPLAKAQSIRASIRNLAARKFPERFNEEDFSA